MSVQSPNTPRVARLWPLSKIIIFGSGPSLCTQDVAAVQSAQAGDRAIRVIAISDAYRLAPWADVIYSPDARWWDRSPLALECKGLKFSLQHSRYTGVTRLAMGRQPLIEDDDRFLSTGGHAGWQAVNLAKHLGAATIVTLGYDMQPAKDGTHHFFGEHPDKTHVRYQRWLPLYDDLPRQLAQYHITIVNASRVTAITGLPRASLSAALCL